MSGGYSLLYSFNGVGNFNIGPLSDIPTNLLSLKCLNIALFKAPSDDVGNSLSTLKSVDNAHISPGFHLSSFKGLNPLFLYA